ELVRVEQTFADVWRRFAPWIWAALVVMAVTGLLLVIAEPVREFTSLSFWLKMALIVVGVVGTIAFRRAFAPAELTRHYGFEFSAAAKAAAAGMLGLRIVGVVGTIAFRRAFAPGELTRHYDFEFSAGAKAAAVGMLGLWIAVIFLGRAIAYDVEVWGSLSLAAGVH